MFDEKLSCRPLKQLSVPPKWFGFVRWPNHHKRFQSITLRPLLVEQHFGGGGVFHWNQGMILHAVVVKISGYILKIAEIKLPADLATFELLAFDEVLKIRLYHFQSSEDGIAIVMFMFQVASNCALRDVGCGGQNGAVVKL